MKCDKCQANDATVHEVMIKGGKRHETHLCEQCAKSAGLSPQVIVTTPITQLLTPFLTDQSEAAGAAAGAPATGGGAGIPANTCTCCGLSFAQFRTNGLLGCPECYTVFESLLTPMIARAHEGGTHHVGKSPVRPLAGQHAGGTQTSGATATLSVAPRPEAEEHAKAERITMLKKRLAEAIAGEQYEKAAKLRDELARFEGGIVAPKRAAKKTPPKREPGQEGGA